jgi:hypothetical protein
MGRFLLSIEKVEEKVKCGGKQMKRMKEVPSDVE